MKAPRECCHQKAFENSLIYHHFPLIGPPFLDGTNFTALCCARPWGLRGCDSFRSRHVLSDIDASACQQGLHPHAMPVVHPTHSTHAYTLYCERVPSCLVLCCRPWGIWEGSEESRVHVALFGKTCRSGKGCSWPAALTFWQFSKVCKSSEGHRYAVRQSEHSTLTSHLIFVHQTPFPTHCLGNAYVQLCSWAKKRVTFYSISQWRIAKAKKAIHSCHHGQRHTPRRKRKQLLFWSRHWSDSSSSATDGSFDVGRGKPLGFGDSPSLDQSAHVYLYWPPGPFLHGDPVR